MSKLLFTAEITARRVDLVIILKHIIEAIEKGSDEMTDYEKTTDHIYWELAEKN